MCDIIQVTPVRVSDQIVEGYSAIVDSFETDTYLWLRDIGDGCLRTMRTMSTQDLMSVIEMCEQDGVDALRLSVGPERQTLLHYAVEEGRIGVVRALIAAGADIHELDSSGRSVINKVKDRAMVDALSESVYLPNTLKYALKKSTPLPRSGLSVELEDTSPPVTTSPNPVSMDE